MDQNIFNKTDAFFKQYPLVRIRQGQSLFSAEQEVPDIYWLRRGAIRLHQITEGGTEITMHIFTAPSFFPMMFYLSHRNMNYFFTATEDVIARKAPAAEVEAFLQENPDVLMELTRRFADAITGLLTRIEQQSTYNSAQRIAELLLYLDQKFGRDDVKGRRIMIKLTHDDLAAWVGAARETVSRQVEKLQEAKLISVKQHYFYLHDLDRLKAKTK